MSVNLLNIILFLAAAQGVLLAILIFQKHRRLFASRFLGAMMLLYSILLAQMLLTDLGLDRKFPHMLIIPIGISLLMGPLHYLYARSLIRSSKKIKKSDWLHFLPFAIYELSIVPSLFKPSQELAAEMQRIYVEGLPIKYFVFNWFVLLQILSYMILTVVIIRRYSSSIKNIFSTIEKVQLDWLRNITYMGIFVVTVFFIENIFLLAGINLSHFFNLTSVLFAIFIYVMGYMGLLKSEIFAEPAIANSISQLPQLSYQAPADGIVEPPKYQKSGLSPEKAKKYLSDLLQLMEDEQPYTDSELTLSQLADRLAISPHNLSEILNTQLNQNFFDFINHYRVEAAKKGLADPGKQQFTILAIGFEAGFNSKTAFNTIFKKHTKMTPTEYRAQLDR